MIVGAILERSGLCKRVVYLEQSVSSSQSTRRGRMQWDAAAIDIIEIVDDAESPGPAEIVEVRSHSNSIEVVSDEESLGAPIMRSGSNKASAKDSCSHKLDKARTVRRALLKERKRQQAEMKARVMSESNSSLQRKMWQCAWPKLEKPEGLDLRGRMSLGQVAKLLAIHKRDVREYRAIVAWAALQQQSDHLNELLRKHGAWVHRQSECGQTLAQAIAICSGPSSSECVGIVEQAHVMVVHRFDAAQQLVVERDGRGPMPVVIHLCDVGIISEQGDPELMPWIVEPSFMCDETAASTLASILGRNPAPLFTDGLGWGLRVHLVVICDSAEANILSVAMLASRLHPLVDLLFCRCDCHMLVAGMRHIWSDIGDVRKQRKNLTVCAGSIIAHLHRAAATVSTHLQWQSFKQALRAVVRKRLRVTRVPPSSEARAFNRTLLDTCYFPFHHGKRNKDKGEALLEGLGDVRDGIVELYHPASALTHAQAVQYMLELLEPVCLARRPGWVCLQKWMGNVSVLGWCLLVLSLLGKDIFEISLTERAAGDDAEAPTGADEGDRNFAKEARVRAKRVIAWVNAKVLDDVGIALVTTKSLHDSLTHIFRGDDETGDDGRPQWDLQHIHGHIAGLHNRVASLLHPRELQSGGLWSFLSCRLCTDYDAAWIGKARAAVLVERAQVHVRFRSCGHAGHASF